MNDNAHIDAKHQPARRTKTLTGGDKLVYEHAVVLHLPGTMWRVFWKDGKHSDFSSETDAVAAVEKQAA